MWPSIDLSCHIFLLYIFSQKPLSLRLSYVDFVGPLVQSLACNAGPGGVYAVTAVQHTLYQFMPDVNKQVVSYHSDATSAQSASQGEVSTTPT